MLVEDMLYRLMCHIFCNCLQGHVKSLWKSDQAEYNLYLARTYFPTLVETVASADQTEKYPPMPQQKLCSRDLVLVCCQDATEYQPVQIVPFKQKAVCSLITKTDTYSC